MPDISQTLDTNQPSPAEKKLGGVKVIAIFSLALGLLVLCGWAWDIDTFKRVLPGMVTMKANAATAFALSGISLYLHTLRQISIAALLIRRITAILVLLIGLVTLCEYFFGWDAGIDQLLFSEPAGAILTSHPGRMAIVMAANSALIGAALLLIERRLWIAAQAAACAVAVFALLSLVSYMFGETLLIRIGNTTMIAAHAATGCLLLAMGVLLTTQNHGLMLRLQNKFQTIGLIASLVTLLITFVAASYNLTQKDKASQWVEHTYEVIQSMEYFSGSMHDYLYHNRAFLITGNERQLIEKNKSQEAMLAELTKVHEMTTNNPVQHEWLIVLDKLVEQRIEQADLAVWLRREKGFAAAAALVASGKGETLTNEIEAKLNDLKNTEKNLLKERQKTAEVVSSSSLFTLGIMSAASFLLLLWIFRASQREITERKRAEEKLHTASLYVRSLIEASLDPLVTISSDGKITDANKASEEATGISRNELIGTDFSGYFTEPEKAQTGYRQVFDQEFVRDYPLTIRHKTGSLIDVLYNATIYRDDAGHIQGVFAAARDITERKRAEEQLRISEERLALAVRTGNIGIWDWDVPNNILLWDDSMYRLYGLRRGDFGGAYEAWASALHPEDKAYTEGEIQAGLRGEREYAPEFRVIWPDGSIHYLKAASHTLFDAKGKPLRMVGINYDLTERKLAEKELREKEERLALATIQNGVGVWDWNLLTQEMIWDDSMYALYRIRREDFIGTEEAWRKSLHPDDLHRGDQEVNDAIAGIKPFNTEFRVVWPNGEIHHIKAVAKVFRDEQGTPYRMLGINMDITERKQAEAALRASEDRLHSIIQTSMDGIVQMDADGIITGWNNQMEKVFGWLSAEVIGQALHETIIPPRHREAHVNGLKHFLLSGEGPALNKRIEVSGLHRDGNIFPVELTVTPIKMGEKYEFSAFLRDITEAKRAKEEIYRLNAELEQRVVERTAKLEAANKDMESFSYSISHDLRAPLRAINGFSKILQEEYVDRLDDEGKRLLNVVGDNARKMGELIDDILAFSRAGRNEINRSVIDMKNMVTGIWEELKPDMAGRNVRLDMRDIPPAEGDSAMIHQVVFNLLSNAVKFTRQRPNARIEVGGQTDEHETIYHIKDNGAGFNMQYTDKLFGVFLRLHGMDEFEGTGIGLAIVKRIITKHGGRVWAEGKVGEGATFYFALPKR